MLHEAVGTVCRPHYNVWPESWHRETALGIQFMQASERGRGQDVDGRRVEKRPSGRLKSVTLSRCSRPSISSQYSSDVSLLDAAASRQLRSIFSSRTSRLSAAERIR